MNIENPTSDELVESNEPVAGAELVEKELEQSSEPLVARAPVRPDSPTFAQLGARPETVEALAAVGIINSFAIQEYALPIAIRGTDLIGQAPTGTGKTLGFGIPVLERILAPAEGADGRPQALIVVPTRELGLQVARDIKTAGSTRGVRVLPIYGGVAYEPQTDALKKGVEIIVGTPGRLLDLAKSKQLKLDAIRALVLDEADRMLDLGFLDDVEKILAMVPSDRQTMLFSATMPDPIVALSRRFLRNPVTIHAGHTAETGPSPLTKQVVYRTHSLNKLEMVARILQVARPRPDHGVHAGPSAPPTGLPRTSISAVSRSRPCTVTLARVPANGRCGRSAAARSTCWSRPTSPPVAWTSPASPTLSTTTARRTPTPTRTGSAAPAGPAPPVSP